MNHFYKFDTDSRAFYYSNINSVFDKLSEYYVPTPNGKLPPNDRMTVHKEGGINFDTVDDLESIMEDYDYVTISIGSQSRKYFNIKKI
jgi:hypothetical protein